MHILQARFHRTGPAPGRLRRAFPELQSQHLAADPYGDPFVYGLGPPIGAALGTAAAGVRDPLGADAGRYYQFRSGDTAQVRLDGGRTVETVPVTVIPRYRSIRLVAAILWIDPASMALVRVAYRPAKRVDREMRGRLRHDGEWQPRVWIDGGGGGGAPGGDAAGTLPGDDPASAPGPRPASAPPSLFDRLVNMSALRMAAKVEMDLAAVVVDFAPWEGRHWLPRSVRWDGHMAWEIVSATAFVPPGAPFAVDWTVDIEAVRAPGEPLPPMPADPEAPAGSDLLLPSIWQGASSVWRDTSSVRRDNPPVAAELAAIGIGQGGDRSEAANPWFYFPPGMALGFMRYNPVEGFSTGGLVRRDFGWWRSALTVRFPTRDWAVPDMDFTLQHDHPQRRTQLSVYRALRGGALGIGGLEGWPGYFVTAADSLNFHWSHGATLRFTPGNGKRTRLSLSLFAERDAEIETDEERTRVGGALEWKPWWGAFGDGSVGGGGNVVLRGSLGDNSHAKAIVEGALVVPLAWRFSLGLQAGTARVWGHPAPQDLWQVGATGHWFRGYGAALETSRTWMGRVDLQRSVRFLHLSIYGDRAAVEGADYCAAGAGIVFMNGVFRLDVARGLECGTPGSSEGGWRVHPRAFTFF